MRRLVEKSPFEEWMTLGAVRDVESRSRKILYAKGVFIEEPYFLAYVLL